MLWLWNFWMVWYMSRLAMEPNRHCQGAASNNEEKGYWMWEWKTYVLGESVWRSRNLSHQSNFRFISQLSRPISKYFRFHISYKLKRASWLSWEIKSWPVLSCQQNPIKPHCQVSVYNMGTIMKALMMFKQVSVILTRSSIAEENHLLARRVCNLYLSFSP